MAHRRDDRRGDSGFFETQDRVDRKVERRLAVLDVGQDHFITQVIPANCLDWLLKQRALSGLEKRFKKMLRDFLRKREE